VLALAISALSEWVGYGFEGTPIELKIRGRVKRRKRFADYFAL
jgi:hypothetical protein